METNPQTGPVLTRKYVKYKEQIAGILLSINI